MHKQNIPKKSSFIVMAVTTCLLIPGISSAQAITTDEATLAPASNETQQNSTDSEFQETLKNLVESESKTESIEVAETPTKETTIEDASTPVETTETPVDEPVLKKFSTIPDYRFFQQLRVGEDAFILGGVGWKEKPTISYVWEVDGKVIPTAKNAKLTLLPQYGQKRVVATVTASLEGYETVVVKKLSAIVESTPITLDGYNKPIVSGRAVVDSVLTASDGKWQNLPKTAKMTYQWYQSGKAIPNAKSKTYKITKADLNKNISVSVEPVQVGYKAKPAMSSAVTVLNKFTKIPKPTISGKSEVGSKLTASAAKWTPVATTVKYQWTRNGAPIQGATKSTYVLSKHDAGKKIAFRVEGTKKGYETFKISSVDRAVLSKISGNATTPRGEIFTGKTLTAAHSFAVTKGTYKYQWTRNGANIKGATKNTYKLTTADRGKKIAVKITASKAGFYTRTSTSPAITGSTVWLDQTRASLDRMGGGKSVKLVYSNTQCEHLRKGIEACSTRGTIYISKTFQNSRYNKTWMLQHELAHQYQYKVLDKLNKSKKYKQLFGGNIESLANAMATTRGSKMGSWSKAQLDYARGIYAGKV